MNDHQEFTKMISQKYKLINEMNMTESANMNFILSHKEKVYFMKDMDEVRAMKEIERNLSQEKIEFINDSYQKESHYPKKTALENVLNENGMKQLTDLAPPRVF